MATNTTRYGIRKPDGDERWALGDVQIDNAADDVDALLTPFSQGPAASRPVSSGGSPSGKAGREYYSADTGLIEKDFGTGWVPLNGGLVYAGGTAGALYTIASQAVGTPELADKAATYQKIGDPAITLITGTTYTVQASDRNKWLVTTSSAPVTITIPTGVLAAPSEFALTQEGTGQVTVVGSGTSIVNRPMKFKLAGQYSYATFLQRVTDTFLMLGDVA